MRATLARDFGVHVALGREPLARHLRECAATPRRCCARRASRASCWSPMRAHEWRASARVRQRPALRVRARTDRTWVAPAQHDPCATCRNSMRCGRSTEALYELLGDVARRCWPRCTCAGSRPEPGGAHAAMRPSKPKLPSSVRRAGAPATSACWCSRRSGSAGVVVLGEGEFLLQVPHGDAAYAVQHLLQYEAENRPPPPPPPPPAPVSVRLGRLRRLRRGARWASRRRSRTGWCAWMPSTSASSMPRGCRPGEWWRAWTALTLHLDGPHLAANLVAGVWFGYLAGRADGRRHGLAPHRDRRGARESARGAARARRSISRSAPRPRCSPPWGRCRRTPGASASRRRSAGRGAGGRWSPASCCSGGRAPAGRGPTSSRTWRASPSGRCSGPPLALPRLQGAAAARAAVARRARGARLARCIAWGARCAAEALRPLDAVALGAQRRQRAVLTEQAVHGLHRERAAVAAAGCPPPRSASRPGRAR